MNYSYCWTVLEMLVKLLNIDRNNYIMVKYVFSKYLTKYQILFCFKPPVISFGVGKQ